MQIIFFLRKRTWFFVQTERFLRAKCFFGFFVRNKKVLRANGTIAWRKPKRPVSSCERGQHNIALCSS